MILASAVRSAHPSTFMATLAWAALWLLAMAIPPLIPTAPLAGPPEGDAESAPSDAGAQSGTVVTIDRESGQMVVELSSGRRVAMLVPPHAVGDFRPGDRLMLEADDEPGR